MHNKQKDKKWTQVKYNFWSNKECSKLTCKQPHHSESESNTALMRWKAFFISGGGSLLAETATFSLLRRALPAENDIQGFSTRFVSWGVRKLYARLKLEENDSLLFIIMLELNSSNSFSVSFLALNFLHLSTVTRPEIIKQD